MHVNETEMDIDYLIHVDPSLSTLEPNNPCPYCGSIGPRSVVKVAEIEAACKAIEKTTEGSFVFAVEARELLQAVACIRQALKGG